VTPTGLNKATDFIGAVVSVAKRPDIRTTTMVGIAVVVVVLDIIATSRHRGISIRQGKTMGTITSSMEEVVAAIRASTITIIITTIAIEIVGSMMASFRGIVVAMATAVATEVDEAGTMMIENVAILQQVEFH